MDSSSQVDQLIGAEDHLSAELGKRGRGRVAATIAMALLILIVVALFVLFTESKVFDPSQPLYGPGQPANSGGYEFGNPKSAAEGASERPVQAPEAIEAKQRSHAIEANPPALATPAPEIKPAEIAPPAPTVSEPTSSSLSAPAASDPVNPAIAAPKSTPEAAAPVAVAPSRVPRSDAKPKSAVNPRPAAARSAAGNPASKPCTDTAAALGLCERRPAPDQN